MKIPLPSPLSLSNEEGWRGREKSKMSLTPRGEKGGRGKMSRWHVLGIPRKKKKNKLYRI